MENIKRPQKRGSIGKLTTVLENFRSVLITGHANPDGDSVGSCIALARILEKMGIRAFTSLNSQRVGPLGFLIPSAPANRTEDELHNENIEAVIVLDCGTLLRIPDSLRSFAERLPVINIDHHSTNEKFGICQWSNSSVSATGEMIYNLAKKRKIELDLATAEALWVALITDTGRFAYSCTQPSTLRAASALLACGVDSSKINDIIFLYASPGAIEAKRRAYASLGTWCNGLVSYIFLTANDFIETGVRKSDIEDVINIPRSIETAEVAFFFYEDVEKPGITRLSIRTRNDEFDATKYAVHFGGGGHLRAAGCDILGTLQQAMNTVEKYIEEILEK